MHVEKNSLEAADLLDKAAAHVKRHGLAAGDFIKVTQDPTAAEYYLSSKDHWADAMSCAIGAIGVTSVLDRLGPAPENYSAAVEMFHIQDVMPSHRVDPVVAEAQRALAYVIRGGPVAPGYIFARVTTSSDEIADRLGEFYGAWHVSAVMRHAARGLREGNLTQYPFTDGYTTRLDVAA